MPGMQEAPQRFMRSSNSWWRNRHLAVALTEMFATWSAGDVTPAYSGVDGHWVDWRGLGDPGAFYPLWKDTLYSLPPVLIHSSR
jgi:hypothetical protein